MTAEQIILSLERVYSTLEQIALSESFKALAEHPELIGGATLRDCLCNIEDLSAGIAHAAGFEVSEDE